MPTGIHRKIRLCESGEWPQAILRLASGWVTAGDVQPLRGYCVLLCEPVVSDFNALNEAQRAQYALDMARVGDALISVCGAYRINYETWGNLDPALHTHIVPRYMNESANLRVQTPRQAYDWNTATAFEWSRDRQWVEAVRDSLRKFAIK